MPFARFIVPLPAHQERRQAGRTPDGLLRIYR